MQWGTCASYLLFFMQFIEYAVFDSLYVSDTHQFFYFLAALLIIVPLTLIDEFALFARFSVISNVHLLVYQRYSPSSFCLPQYSIQLLISAIINKPSKIRSKIHSTSSTYLCKLESPYLALKEQERFSALKGQCKMNHNFQSMNFSQSYIKGNQGPRIRYIVLKLSLLIDNFICLRGQHITNRSPFLEPFMVGFHFLNHVRNSLDHILSFVALTCILNDGRIHSGQTICNKCSSFLLALQQYSRIPPSKDRCQISLNTYDRRIRSQYPSIFYSPFLYRRLFCSLSVVWVPIHGIYLYTLGKRNIIQPRLVFNIISHRNPPRVICYSFFSYNHRLKLIQCDFI